MKYRLGFSAIVATLWLASVNAADTASFGVVNFGTCVSDSKLGKQEQDSFETLKKQLSSQMEETEKQLNDMAAKFNDPDYLDGLSPEAEEELKNKFRSLSDSLNQQQNQYYQVMNQANMRIVQNISNAINTASAKVAKEKKLSVVFNKDACFYYADSLDVTKQVVVEMDKAFIETPKTPAKTEQKSK